MATEAVATSMAKDKKGRKPVAKRWRFLPLLLIVAGLGFGYAMGWHRYLTLEFLADSRLALKAFASANPIAAPLGFTLLYAVAVAFSFPAASVLTIFAGFLFGWLFGGVLAIIGATAGATALFLAARTAFGGFLKERAGGAAARLSHGFERDAFSYLLVLRIAPQISTNQSGIALYPVLRRQHRACRLQRAPSDFCCGDADRHPARRLRLCLARPGRR